MRKGYFDVFPFQVDDVIKPLAGHVVFQKVFQTVAGDNPLPIVDESQPRIEISIVA